MWRAMRRAVVFVIPGMLLTVLLAWGLVWWVEPDRAIDRSGVLPTEADQALWNGSVDDVPNGAEIVHRFDGLGVEYTALAGDGLAEGLTIDWRDGRRVGAGAQRLPTGSFVQVRGMRQVSAGWPVRAIRGAVVFEGDPFAVADVDEAEVASAPADGEARGALILRPSQPGEPARFLPWRPMVIGFVIDSIFWGGVLWLFVAAVVMFRRADRLRHGRCPGCGHLRSAGAVCTECGGELPERREPRWIVRPAGRATVVVLLGLLAPTAVALLAGWMYADARNDLQSNVEPDFRWVEARSPAVQVQESYTGVTTWGFERVLYVALLRLNDDRPHNLDVASSVVIAERQRAGWPWPMLGGGWWVRVTERDGWHETSDREYEGALMLDDDNQRWLPMRPVMPGALYNVLTYGAVAWVMFFGLPLVRRFWWRRRGRCRHCGWPRLAGGTCTGCGQAFG